MSSFVEHQIEQLRNVFIPPCASLLISPVRDRAWLRRWLLALCYFWGEFSSVLAGAVSEAPEVHRSALQDRVLFNNLRRHVLALQADTLAPPYDPSDAASIEAESAPSFELHAYSHFLLALPHTHGYAATFAAILAVELMFDAAWQTLHSIILDDIDGGFGDPTPVGGDAEPYDTSDSGSDAPETAKRATAVAADAAHDSGSDSASLQARRRRRPAGLATVALPWIAPPATAFVRWAARHADTMFLYASDNDRQMMIAAFELVPHYHYSALEGVERASSWPAVATGALGAPRRFMPLSIPWCPGGRSAWEGNPDMAGVGGLYEAAVEGTHTVAAGTAGAVLREANEAAAATAAASPRQRAVGSPVPRCSSPRQTHSALRGGGAEPALDSSAMSHVGVAGVLPSRKGGAVKVEPWLRRPHPGGATEGPLLQNVVDDVGGLAASPLQRSRRDWAELLWGSAFRAGAFVIDGPITGATVGGGGVNSSGSPLKGGGRGGVEDPPLSPTATPSTRGDRRRGERVHQNEGGEGERGAEGATYGDGSRRRDFGRAPHGADGERSARGGGGGEDSMKGAASPRTPKAQLGAQYYAVMEDEGEEDGRDVGEGERSLAGVGVGSEGGYASAASRGVAAEVASDSTGLRTFVFASDPSPRGAVAGSGRAAASQLHHVSPAVDSRRPQRVRM